MPVSTRARRQAEVLVPLLDELGLPAWFSYSIEGDATRAGQPLRDAWDLTVPIERRAEAKKAPRHA